MIYEFQIQYTSEEKTKKETFLVEKFYYFLEVERFAFEYFGGLAELEVIAIKRSKIKEIANTRQNDDEQLWMAELMDTFLTDEGEEKTIKYKIVFFSKTFDTAKEFIAEYSKQGYSMALVSLKLTRFDDVLS